MNARTRRIVIVLAGFAVGAAGAVAMVGLAANATLAADAVAPSKAPSSSPPPATPPATGPSPQRFEPTEKVRADFEVSFPIDI